MKIKEWKIVVGFLVMQLLFTCLYITLSSVKNVFGYHVEAWHVIVFDIIFIFIITIVGLFVGEES